ncbi:MAG: EamA family transporter [Ilumatobacter sp.]|nr:EamA family transporter [Ilumatobacter sp.]
MPESHSAEPAPSEPVPTEPVATEPVPTERAGHLRAIGLALVVTVLWSSSWILIRVGLDDEELAPLTFAGLRYTLAASVLLAVTASRPSLRRELAGIGPPMWRRLALLGVVFFTVTQGAQFVAIDSQPAATSSLMLAPTAFFVALFSARSISERSSRRQLVGAALVAIGAAVYFSGDLGATVIGMTASVIGLSANVTGSLLGRSVNRSSALSPILVTVGSMGVGAVLLLVAGLVIEGWPALTVTVVLIIVWLAVVNTALAFTLWNRSLRRLAAVESAAINNTMLIQIATLAWVFLGEGPGVVGVAGILIVSAGTFLTTVSTGARRRRPVPSDR